MATNAYADRAGADHVQPLPTPTLAANALTIPAAQYTLDFRSATLANGGVTTITGTPEASTISSGSTLGFTSAVQGGIAVLVANDAGTLRYAYCNAGYGINLSETGLISTTAEGGAGGADSATTIYSTVAMTNVAYRQVGIYRQTQGTAGTWVTAPSLVQGAGGNYRIEPAAPAFSAYRSGDQSITSSTWTQVLLNAEEFDTDAAFISATNYNFSPMVAGYYQISGSAAFSTSNSPSTSYVAIYKNGSIFKRGSGNNVGYVQSISALIYFNGTTDYVELWAYVIAATASIDGGAANTYMCGHLARRA